MSHFTRLKTQMVEKEYLTQALRDLGYGYEEGSVKVYPIVWTKKQSI